MSRRGLSKRRREAEEDPSLELTPSTKKRKAQRAELMQRKRRRLTDDRVEFIGVSAAAQEMEEELALEALSGPVSGPDEPWVSNVEQQAWAESLLDPSQPPPLFSGPADFEGATPASLQAQLGLEQEWPEVASGPVLDPVEMEAAADAEQVAEDALLSMAQETRDLQEALDLDDGPQPVVDVDEPAVSTVPMIDTDIPGGSRPVTGLANIQRVIAEIERFRSPDPVQLQRLNVMLNYVSAQLRRFLRNPAGELPIATRPLRDIRPPQPPRPPPITVPRAQAILKNDYCSKCGCEREFIKRTRPVPRNFPGGRRIWIWYECSYCANVHLV